MVNYDTIPEEAQVQPAAKTAWRRVVVVAAAACPATDGPPVPSFVDDQDEDEPEDQSEDQDADADEPEDQSEELSEGD